MDTNNFATALHQLKCKSITSMFSNSDVNESASISKAVEVDSLAFIRNGKKIAAAAISSNFKEDKIHKMEGVKMTEDAFSKAVETEKLEVYTHDTINLFKRNLVRAISLEKANSSDLEKAQKDISMLTKVVVSLKAGGNSTVFVKRTDKKANK